ncbi:MAG: hypothetical protein ACR2O1_12570 [Boseongicola sp.]
MIKLIATVFAVLLVLPASAKELSWPQSEWNSNPVSKQKGTNRRSKRIKRSKKRKPKVVAHRRSKHSKRSGKRTPQVKGSVFTKLNGFVCAKEFKVYGQVKSNEVRARRSAWTAFHRAVKFELGERFADQRFAKNVKFRCPESSSETLANKAVEAIGGEVKRVSCTLRALACQPPESD